MQSLEPVHLVPLINLLLLLIFFMLCNSFMPPSGIHVKLPKAVTSDTLEEENFIITITSEDIIYFRNTVYTTKELRAELGKPANKKRPVLIKADRRASMGRIVDVWDLCRQLGIDRINIATSREQ